METEVTLTTGTSGLPWPEGGGTARYGYTPGAARFLEGALARAVDAAGFMAVAASWRSADHAAVVRAWSEDCGRWNRWVNGHQCLYDAFVHEPTARLLDGLEAGRRCAEALGLPVAIEPADADAFVAAWHQVANHEVPDPVAFGPLLADPPDAWAVGLTVGSLLIANGGDAMPATFESLLRAVELSVGR